MANTFMSNMQNTFNYNYTTNGALAHKSTGSKLYDMFALGAAYRGRSEADCLLLFKNAFEENETYAMKCLFWMRDCRGGAGERRFFRLCLRWLAKNHPEAVRRNLKQIAMVGRWDDYYELVGTCLEAEMFAFLRKQLELDAQTETPSLLAKWLKSVNTSSVESRKLGKKTAKAFRLTEKQYRQILSILRKRINVLERLMSEQRWDEIKFDKIPSKAGLIYRNAFARHDIERMKAGTQTYKDFANDDNSKVNTSVNAPYEMVREVTRNLTGGWGYRNSDVRMDDTQRKMLNKYWEQQKDYLDGKPCKMMCVVDTSGSMRSGAGKLAPIDVAISLGMYCAERVGGPFKNNYISFSRKPRLIEIEGLDFVDKVRRIYDTNLCENTNLTATFDLIRNLAMKSNHDDVPETLVVISDMQIDGWGGCLRKDTILTDMEEQRIKWAQCGLAMPSLVYWNVNATNDTILDLGPNVSYVSGASATLFKQVLTGKTGYDLMMETLNQEKYKDIR